MISQVLFYALVAFFRPTGGKSQGTFDIPVTFNPLIQKSVKLSSNTDLFYKMDEQFYSKVTVVDAALNTEQHIKDMIKKTISVVFLTIASSHVSKTLQLQDLRHTTQSKWSYTLEVQSILNASDGAIQTLSDKATIYQIQESAMKVLEERYEFTVRELLQKLRLTSMEFYGVTEKQWINAVGIITEKVINARSETLNLTSCYLAELVDKTLEEIRAFTLNEVDTYLYNTNVLADKLPSYQKIALASLYQTFNITETEFATISNTDISAINKMNFTAILQLFTKSILKVLYVTEEQIIRGDKRFNPEMILSCTDKWELFRSRVVSTSFDNAAKSMSITNEILGLLIGIPHGTITGSTINQLRQILERSIEPLKKDKKLIETSILSEVVNLHGEGNVNIKRENVYAAIYRFTNFTQHQLTLLYHWTSQDYQFASLFSLEDLDNVCSLNSEEYNLLTLATVNIGEEKQGIQCKSLQALRRLWENQNVNRIGTIFFPDGKVPCDLPIANVVSRMTNASSSIVYRVLNISTSETQQLLQKITFNNISAVTSYSCLDLKTKSFQDIVELVVQLHQNGSFDNMVKVVSYSPIQSTAPSSSKVGQPYETSSTTSLYPTHSFVSSSNIQPTEQSGAATTRLSWTSAIVSSVVANISPSYSTAAPSYNELETSRSVLQTSTSITVTSSLLQKTDSAIRSSSSIPMISTTTIENTEQGSLISGTETNVVKSSSYLLLKSSSATSGKHVKASSSHLLNSTAPILQTSSVQIPPLLSSSVKGSVASIKPSATKPVASSSITKPDDICKPSSCKTDQVCIVNSGRSTCKDAQNLQGKFRITGGATFSQELTNSNSEHFRNLSRHIAELIDSVYQKSNSFSSSYLGCEVINFTQGSIITFFKLSFRKDSTLSSDTVEEIERTLVDGLGKNAQNSFQIDTNSTGVQDYDECATGRITHCYVCKNTLGSYKCICPEGKTGDGQTCQDINNSSRSGNKDDVPWIIYVVIAIMVLLIIFLIVVIIYCEKKHKKKYRPQVLDFHNGGINMYPRSTSYLAQTPESEADITDGLGIVNRHGPPPNMVTFNPSPEEPKEIDLQHGQPGMLRSFKWIDPD